jgi:hypothetical protein
MKLLILCPGKIPLTTNDIRCFTEVINYYLPAALGRVADTAVLSIPSEDGDNLKQVFDQIDTDGYDAILTLGLRFYSKISLETTNILRKKFNGLLCQTHDGSRLDYDPVDITFTFKNDSHRLSSNSSWMSRHTGRNEYIGWAADPELNYPCQSSSDLRILVDHTNYGDNEIDETKKVLEEIRRLVSSNAFSHQFKSISVRRFDSGKVVDVDLNDLRYERYDRTQTMPIAEISKEHSAAHVFCVTHPESVGLVVLETALAGAIVVSPKNFIPADRLATVRHVEWEHTIDWGLVLDSIDIEKSRATALPHNWSAVAANVINIIQKRITNE